MELNEKEKEQIGTEHRRYEKEWNGMEMKR